MFLKEKRYFISIILVLAFMLSFISCGFYVDANTGNTGYEDIKVTFFKVGKADAIVLESKDETIVIDAGEEEDGLEILEYLMSQDIDTIDTLIITHFDKDHVGGADTLVENLDIGKVIMPDYEGTNTEYSDFISALTDNGIEPIRLVSDMSFSFSDADILVEPPLSYEIPDTSSEYDNNFSLITTLTHGDNVILFTGDIEKKRIREWISEGEHSDVTLIKMPHHGVYNSALTELIEEVNPKFAIICSSEKNPADSETIELLDSYGIETYETKDGNIVVSSNGETLKISQ